MALADLGDLASVPTWWLSPRDLSTITKDGSDRVSAIADKGSGGGGGAAQSTNANMPLYVAASNIGGQPALRTDGADDFMTFTQPWSDVSAVRLTNSTTSITVSVLGTNYNTDAGAHALTSPTLLMLRWSGTSLTFWDNGVLKRIQGVGSTAAPGTLFFVVGLSSAGESTTGRVFESGYLYNRAANDRTADGDHGDFAYYDSAIGDTLREQIEGVLCWAYGIALPSGHPYESAAPTTGGGTSLSAAGAMAGSGLASGAVLAVKPLAGAATGVGVQVVSGGRAASASGSATGACGVTGDMSVSAGPGSSAGAASGVAMATAGVLRRTPLVAASAGTSQALGRFGGASIWSPAGSSSQVWLSAAPLPAAWAVSALAAKAWVASSSAG